MIWIYVVGAIAILIGAGAFFGAPYVPSRKRDLVRMFDTLYPISKNDVLFDAGSGDGLVLREASRRGARAIGYEINPFFWAIAALASRRDPNVIVKLRNFWLESPPNNVTVFYIFSVTRDGKRLITKLRQFQQQREIPLTVICYGSPLPGIEPDKTFEAYSLYKF